MQLVVLDEANLDEANLDEANRELVDALAWLSRHDEAAAIRFSQSAGAVLEQLRHTPYAAPAWPELPDARVCAIRGSRYRVVYQVLATTSVVRVLASAHTSRRPGDWRARAP